MRNQLVEIEKLQNGILERESSEVRRLKKFEENRIPEERIQSSRVDMAKNQLYLAILRYSIGSDIDKLYPNFNKALQYISNYWSGYWKLKKGSGEIFEQYILSAYDEMLWMLSIGYLMDIEGEEFEKLVDVIDRDQVKDHLFEFIIRAKLPDRKPIEEESYREHFGVPEVFKTLREAIKQTDKEQAQKLIAQFIKKEWYPNHKDAGWYNSHKSKHNTYFGYWSFETAAVVAIMGLDDSSFRDCEYYPKDLVDYYRENHPV